MRREKKGVIKAEAEREENNEREKTRQEIRKWRKKRRRDKHLLGIIMQLFLTFQDLAVHCRIPN